MFAYVFSRDLIGQKLFARGNPTLDGKMRRQGRDLWVALERIKATCKQTAGRKESKALSSSANCTRFARVRGKCLMLFRSFGISPAEKEKAIEEGLEYFSLIAS
ncbi:hypothetical protein Trydic_g5937 [Trypoxylus dichotomus]